MQKNVCSNRMFTIRINVGMCFSHECIKLNKYGSLCLYFITNEIIHLRHLGVKQAISYVVLLINMTEANIALLTFHIVFAK